MKYRLYRPNELSTEQWQVYAALRDARAIYDDPFFDPDFARLVGEVRDDTRVGFASDRHGVFAIWPMHIRPGNWARPIGSPFSDWNGPILAENVELSPEEILSGFDLSGFTTQGFLPQQTQAPDKVVRAGANISDLTAGWNNFFAEQQIISPRHFKKMRRIYRNIERDFDAMRFEYDDLSDESFERVIALKQEQFARTGYHNVLKAPWARQLLDRLRTFEGPRLRARVSTLFFDDQLAACELNLQSDTVLHGWIVAFEQSYKRYSPGHVMLQELLRHACEDDIRFYDSGPGLDDYKRHYTNVQMPIESGVVQGTVVDLSPVRVAGRAWRFGEQVLPGKAGALMARARRRMDQVAATETTFSGRAGGMFHALGHRPV